MAGRGGVQFEGASAPKKKRVYYSGTDALLVGYNLCYDHLAPVTGDKKLQMGAECVKPATANLSMYAGVVLNAITGPGFVEIATADAGEFVTALTKAAAATQGTQALGPVNGEYWLAVTASATVAQFTNGENVDTSVTEANERVMWKASAV